MLMKEMVCLSVKQAGHRGMLIIPKRLTVCRLYPWRFSTYNGGFFRIEWGGFAPVDWVWFDIRKELPYVFHSPGHYEIKCYPFT